jgi:hypothetical protein
MNSRSFLVTLIWIAALIGVIYHASEMHMYVWNAGDGVLNESPSAVQQAAMAAYRTGMMVLFYALGRGLTDTIKVTIPSDE